MWGPGVGNGCGRAGRISSISLRGGWAAPSHRGWLGVRATALPRQRGLLVVAPHQRGVWMLWKVTAPRCRRSGGDSSGVLLWVGDVPGSWFLVPNVTDLEGAGPSASWSAFSLFARFTFPLGLWCLLFGTHYSRGVNLLCTHFDGLAEGRSSRPNRSTM